jgi:two-component system chemotaxis response regulator CheB
MAKIRVLIVDDAVVVRHIVSGVLTTDPDLEVVGSAANGLIALAKIPQVNPDVITLDVEMPEMDGLETLVAIRRQYPHLPVIMFSTLTHRGASATLDALAMGANDYVTKPSNVGSLSAAQQSLREQLIPKIKVFCGKSARSVAGPAKFGEGLSRSQQFRAMDSAPGVVEAIAIGASTGGPNALTQLVSSLPENFPVPIFIVQHMPAVFTRLLAERLDQKSPLKVCEAAPGDEVRPGCVYVAPGNFHMTLKREGSVVRIQTNQEPPENLCRPAVDVLFQSVANIYGAGIFGVILTGMGEDGLRGCQRIRENGGQIITQDESSSAVWGMPGIVTKAGLSNKVVPLREISNEIVRRVNLGRTPGSLMKKKLTTV